jgi:hypothetical protein
MVVLSGASEAAEQILSWSEVAIDAKYFVTDPVSLRPNDRYL